MATVNLPDSVLQHLAEVHAQQHDYSGWFRMDDLKKVTGWSRTRCSVYLRELFAAGRLHTREFALSAEQAHAMGYLGGCRVRMYRLDG